MARGTIIKRENKRGASYMLRVDNGKDANGKRIQIAQTYRTKREAEAALNAIVKDAQDGNYTKPPRRTTAEYLRKWLADLQVNPRSLARYRVIVEKHLVPAIGEVPLDKLAPQHVQHVQARGRASCLSPKTVRQHHMLLSQALKQAEMWGMVPRNVARLVRAPRLEYREARFLKPEEAARLIEAARPTPYYVPIALLLATGLRRGELLGLEWGDVDLATGNVQVRRAFTKERELSDVKTAQSRRRVALPPSAVLLLRVHKVEALAQAPLSEGTPVFCTPAGERIRPDTLTTALRRIARAAGIDGVHLHSLRHSHASLLLAQGANLKDIQARLGHASLAMTGDLYSHLTADRERETAARFDCALDGAEVRAQTVHNGQLENPVF